MPDAPVVLLRLCLLILFSLVVLSLYLLVLLPTLSLILSSLAIAPPETLPCVITSPSPSPLLPQNLNSLVRPADPTLQEGLETLHPSASTLGWKQLSSAVLPIPPTTPLAPEGVLVRVAGVGFGIANLVRHLTLHLHHTSVARVSPVRMYLQVCREPPDV